MYSYEDRIRAVKRFINLGRRVAETIHQSGYPKENALNSWHRAYEQGSDLPRGYARTKPKYSPAQQTLIIEHYLSHGRCIAATTKTLGAGFNRSFFSSSYLCRQFKTFHR